MSGPFPASAAPARFRSVEIWVLGPAFMALIAATARFHPTVTVALTVASMVMFLACLWAAHQLLGRRAANVFALVAVCVGWFAEQMGSTLGWFFGRYTYTSVLGIQLGQVPLVIPLMWFALCFIGYVMACLLLWREPVRATFGWPGALLTAWLAAMIVTAYDLGADPYFVFSLGAWVMEKKDGGWFGETLQGFVGWMFIAWVIVTVFQRWASPSRPAAASRLNRRAALIPLGIYGSSLAFQVVMGHPIETRTVAFFAMGIPLLVSTVAWWQWTASGEKAQK